jgi:hypothetical protein
MKASTHAIMVFKTFSAEDRLTREGGEKLRLLILERLKKFDSITLDLSEKPIASVSFWDEGIAKLLQNGLKLRDLKEKIIFKNILARDLEIIDRLIKSI